MKRVKRKGNAIASEATRVSILRNFLTVKTLLRNRLVRGVVQAMCHLPDVPLLPWLPLSVPQYLATPRRSMLPPGVDIA